MEHIDNLSHICREINVAEKEAGRKENSTRIIAVSKKFSATHIRPVLSSGHIDFGENRIQEAEDKWPALKEEFPDIILHLIGPLQTNKAKQAVSLFDVIHTVDRPKLARILSQEIQAQGRSPKLFVQVNTGEEEQKSGIHPGEADAFIKMCRGEYGLEISGLMCIPPVDEAPSLHFTLLAKIAHRNDITDLSMGMSSDYQTAVLFGATYVRIGEAIFGKRTYEN